MSTTILYFGGSSLAIEDFLREHPEKFKNTGVLLSYWNLRSTGCQTYRRMKSILEEEDSEDES